MERAKIRLFVDAALGAAQCVELTKDQAHYLFSVMRLGDGDRVALFNGRDGEWTARLQRASKRAGQAQCEGLALVQTMPPDLWLYFAPIKKARTDFIVEKAAELGVRRIVPVQTQFTNAERIRRDRLQAHAVEAAEQCGAVFVPEVAELCRLDAALDEMGARRVMFCDEALAGAGAALDGEKGAPWAILIGPEGGFSDTERAKIAAREGAVAVSLGPRILRADTAAVAAITLWQIRLGDW